MNESDYSVLLVRRKFAIQEKLKTKFNVDSHVVKKLKFNYIRVMI